MDELRKGAPDEDIRAAVVEVALEHHLVSVHEPRRGRRDADRPAGGAASKTAIPGNIPEGLTGFDQLPRTATPAPLLIVAGGLTLLVAGALALWLRVGAPAAATLAFMVFAAFCSDGRRCGRRGAAGEVAAAQPAAAARPLRRRHRRVRCSVVGDAGHRLARAREGRGRIYVRRIPEARGARPLFLRELELATPENSATLQSALGQLYYVNLPRTALVEGPVTEVTLRRRALSPANGRAYALTLGAVPFTLR